MLPPWLAMQLEEVPGDPFYQPRPSRWLPPEMSTAPLLPAIAPSARPKPWEALLINPFYAKSPQGSFGKHVLTPTLALTSIAAATPPQWRVRYWDENLLQGPPPHEPLPAVAGITVHLTFAQRAYQLAAWLRGAGVKVVLGGLHVQSCPAEAADHADAIALGDGVALWPRILTDAERGDLQPRYEANYDGDYEHDPAPRRDLVPRASFLTTASVNGTRGCHNRCTFCYLSTEGVRMPHRLRHPETVCEEIRASGEQHAVFTDNNLGADKAYLRALCRALKPLEIIWSAAVTLDVTDDPALVREMALAGCTGVFIGFETLTDENLSRARKRTPRAADYARRVGIFHDQGIAVNGSFVLGFDGDRRDVFQATAQWIEDTQLACSTFHILTPYPGTPLFRQMESEGRLLHRDWSRYDTAHAVFQPKHLTPEELETGYDWLYRRLFSAASIWKRRPEGLASLLPYLATSAFYKRANPLWRFLIKHQLVHTAWQPVVWWTRHRHLVFRRRLAATGADDSRNESTDSIGLVSASVQEGLV